jgi:hypothetical protein
MKYWISVPICLAVVICVQAKDLKPVEATPGTQPTSLNEANNRNGVKLPSANRVSNNRANNKPPLGHCTRYGPPTTIPSDKETEEQALQRARTWLSQVEVGTVNDEFLPRPQRLRHISGITASPGYGDRDVYWVSQNVAVSEEEEIASGGRHRHYLTNSLHAITSRGQVLAKLTLNADNNDWEDLGAYYDPIEGKNKLYVFDTGEHDWQRNPKPKDPFCTRGGAAVPGTLRDQICNGPGLDIMSPPPRFLIIDEPNLDEALRQRVGSVPLDFGTVTPSIVYEMIYPDSNRTRCYGSYGGGDPFRCNEEQFARFYIHDTEAGIIDPADGTVLMFGKQYPQAPSEQERADARAQGREVNNLSFAYTLSAYWRPDTVFELTKIDRPISPDTAGGASVRYDGMCVVIRNDHEAEEYCKVNPDDALADMFQSGKFKRTHIDLCDPNNCERTIEPEGEAIGYTDNGTALVTTSKQYRFTDPSDSRLEHPNPPPPKIRLYPCTQWE